MGFVGTASRVYNWGKAVRKTGVLWSALRGTAKGVRGVSVFGAKKLYKGGAWGFGYSAKHPIRATAIGSAIMGVGGGIKGGVSASRRMQPPKPVYRRLPPTSGSGYNIWAGRSRSNKFNVNPTGDLSISLHKNRH